MLQRGLQVELLQLLTIFRLLAVEEGRHQQIAHRAQVGGAGVQIVEGLAPYVEGECLVAVDAPLIVVNPKGNRPRYPFVIAEVDKASGLLKQATLRQIDTRQPGEHEILTLSNFYAHEDRVTHDIMLYMTRLFAHNDGWEGDGMRYRVTAP